MLEPTAGSETVRRVPCYLPLLQRIKDRHYYDPGENGNTGSSGSRTFVVEVPLDEIRAWKDVQGGDLADRVTKNTMRYQELFCTVIDKALDGLESSDVDAHGADDNNVRPRDPIEILQEQRMAQQANRDAERRRRMAEAAANTDAGGGDGGLRNNYANDGANGENSGENNNNPGHGAATGGFPPVLHRFYELRILPLGRQGTFPPFARQYHGKSQRSGADQAATGKDTSSLLDGVSLRTVRSKSMGRLVTIRGMIVRASDVKPSCVVATYACDVCGSEVYQDVQYQREFMPPRSCPSPECSTRPNKKRETLNLDTRGSKFDKFQELKLQELPSQVPMGHVPRSMSVYCRGELTRLTSPGDVVTIDGVFLPQRIGESGWRAMRAGLITTTYLEAQNIIVHKKSYDESLLDTLSEEESSKLEAQIMDIATGEDPIGKLSSSLAPEIFGHEDIKRSLLLQLVGGCTRALPDGMKIRGDINICLMGDPGVAKSQLLKHVASIAPRGVYTTGKGSSGVGLTAAVTKDMATGEMALEGGALVLADRGICWYVSCGQGNAS